MTVAVVAADTAMTSEFQAACWNFAASSPKNTSLYQTS